MIRAAALLLTLAGAGCASQWDLDQANARARAMRVRQRALEVRIRTLEAELARRSTATAAGPRAEAPRRAPIEHVVVVRIETAGDVAATVDVDPPAPPDADDRRVPRIEDELISPWPRESRATPDRPDVGTLRIGAEGFFCSASVDGIPVGNTPIAIRTVRAGPHDVTCANAALAYEQTKSVTVARGERTLVRFER